MDALFAVVVAAREDLGLCIMVMTDGTRDLLLQLLHTFLYNSFSHDINLNLCTKSIQAFFNEVSES